MLPRNHCWLSSVHWRFGRLALKASGPGAFNDGNSDGFSLNNYKNVHGFYIL